MPERRNGKCEDREARTSLKCSRNEKKVKTGEQSEPGWGGGTKGDQVAEEGRMKGHEELCRPWQGA